MGFRFVPKSVTLNDLERLMAIILRYLPEFGSFRGQLRKSGWVAINGFSPENVMKYSN